MLRRMQFSTRTPHLELIADLHLIQIFTGSIVHCYVYISFEVYIPVSFVNQEDAFYHHHHHELWMVF